MLAGDREAAAELYPAVVEAKRHGARAVGIDLRFVDTVAGMAATAGRQWELAEEHYRSALRLADEMPHRIEQADVRRLYAAMLAERDAAGDRERARRMIDEAIAMYRKLGMPRQLALAESLLERSRRRDQGRYVRSDRTGRSIGSHAYRAHSHPEPPTPRCSIAPLRAF